MVIAFVHDDSSFLPEIKAYKKFFTQYHIECVSTSYKEAKSVHADVLWYIMGFSLTRSSILTIHEYTSASAPPLAAVKDAAKKWVGAKPDYRIFLNSYVKEKVAADDGVAYGFRDMGVDFSHFYPQPERRPLYDFIYAGNVHPTRSIGKLLDCFAQGAMRGRSLLVLSKNYQSLSKAYADSPNIIFKGPVTQEAVGEHINQAKYAINFMPDKAPYNHQTSTKLLEYLACRIPVVTTSYPWIQEFKSKHGGAYYFLEKDLSNFTWENVQGFYYGYPELHAYTWENQIKASGVLRFLQHHFPALVF